MQQHDPYFEAQNLSSIHPNNKYSGFGVILDTTRGIRVKNPQVQEYSTQIKIIDDQLNPNNFTGTGLAKQYITFFIYWTSEEHQPFPYKIGDIIRFVQFDFEKYHDFLQGKNRRGASWCIFHGDSPNNEPYCQSAEFKERMTQFHVQRLHEIRQWIGEFFEQNLLRNMDWYSYERHLEAPGQIQSFDMMLRVEEIRMPPGQSNGLLVNLIDDKLRRFQTHVSAIHGRFLKEGDVVKLRSIERVEGDYLRGHNRYFAVLGIPSTFKDYKEFVEVFSVQESQDLRRGAMEIEDSGRKLLQAEQVRDFDVALFEKGGNLLQGGSILSSGVALYRKDIPKRTALEILRDLEAQEYERLIAEGNKYQLRATLIDIRPKSLAQSLRNECKNCHVLRKLDAPEGEVCCSRKMERTMLLRLLWQDQSLTASRKLLVSYITPGEDAIECYFPEFPLKDIKPENMEANEKLWDEIVERHLEDDRLFDILLEPVDNEALRDRDGQVCLRLTETLFVPVLKSPSTST